MLSYIVNRDVVDYINNMQGYCEDELGKIQKDFLEKDLPIIDQETARFLENLLLISKPKKILEIGMAVGFSSTLLAKTLPNCHITCIERWDYMIEKAVVTHEKFNVSDRIDIIQGNALDVINDIDDKFDFIFLDFAKGQYINILPKCLDLLNKDGIIFADDIFQNGNIVKDISDVERRQRTIHRRLNQFIKTMCNTNGLKTSILPLADGVLLSYKLIDNVILEKDV